jgi:predicted secreted Zn-dependent protease
LSGRERLANIHLMRHQTLTLIAACLAMTMLSGDTLAKPKVRTQTQHYRVDGADAGAIVRSMMGKHRLLGGQGRVGRTKMTRKVDWEFTSKPGSCRVKRHNVRLDFVTQLPRHAAERRLNARLRKHWRGFAKRVRWHEAQHRKIWLQCARQAERQVNRARASTCGALIKKLEAIYAASNAACDKRHAAFDRSETRKLSKHPLIRASARR